MRIERPPRRSGVFRGSEAAKWKGGLSRRYEAGDTSGTQTAKRTESGFGNGAGADAGYGVGGGDAGEGSGASGGKEDIWEIDKKLCRHPEEAVQDVRYKENDKRCPICDKLLPRHWFSDYKPKKDGIMDAKSKWISAPRGQSWTQVGNHVARGTATEKQRVEQKLQVHGEANPITQYEIGMKLAREANKAGRPLRQRQSDLEQAAGWFRAAAFQEHAKAQYQVALCYLHGRGVKEDPVQAIDFLEKAAREDPDAAFALGNCYHLGIGVKKDEEKSVTWWRKAVDMGHLHAREALKTSAEAASSAAQHAKTAMLREQAKQGDADAQYQIAVRLMEGLALARDETQAVRYYREAAMQGHAAAQCALGLCYFYGRGIQVNVAEAVKWLQMSASAGHGIAMEELASLYQEGVGVSVDIEKAEALRKKAREWELQRVFKYYESQSIPKRGQISVQSDDLLPYLEYVQAQVERLQRLDAKLVLTRAILCSLMTQQRKKKSGFLTFSWKEWHQAREDTLNLEALLLELSGPVCTLMGQEPHKVSTAEAAQFLQDIQDMRALVTAHQPTHKEGNWSKVKMKGIHHHRRPSLSMADIAEERSHKPILELEWSADQVEMAVGGLKVLDHADFVVRYDRKSKKMSAVSLRRTLTGNAAPPGSLLVVPRNHDFESQINSATQSLSDKEAVLNGLLQEYSKHSKAEIQYAKEDVARAQTFLKCREGAETVEQKLAGIDNFMERTRNYNSEDILKRLANAEWTKNTSLEHLLRIPRYRDFAVFSGDDIHEEKHQRVTGQVTFVEEGDPDAQFELGCRYLAGQGCKCAPEMGVYWLTKSANQGQAQAKCGLGMCYATGTGLPAENKQKALELFSEAARMGVTLAHAYLAEMHRMGKAGPRNYLLELDHLRSGLLASDSGTNTWNRAGTRMAELFAHAGDEPSLVPKDYLKAKKYFSDAAETPGVEPRYNPALLGLGELYEYHKVPEGKESYEDKAMALYTEANQSLSNARSQSNIRALPKHFCNQTGSNLSWFEFKDKIDAGLDAAVRPGVEFNIHTKLEY